MHYPLHRVLPCVLVSLIGGCLDADFEEDMEDVDTSTTTAEVTAAPFDLRCLWAGESYASRAPNVFAAEAIRNACRIQTSLIPYIAPGMLNPLQLRPPTQEEGIDCSGLTANVWFRATGQWTRLPHSAARQEAILPDVSWANLLPGDLLFYDSKKAASGRHVKMYLGDGLTIEAASGTQGVVIKPVNYNVTSIGRVW